jgi:hypothetical protein
VLVEHSSHLLLVLGELAIEATDVGNQVATQPDTDPVASLRARKPRSSAEATAAVSEVGAPPASSCRSNACN